MEGVNSTMSPFTELAENLSCLTTCSTVTPRRKVSWSQLESCEIQYSSMGGISSNSITSETPILKKRTSGPRTAFRSLSCTFSSSNSVMDKYISPSHSSHSPVRKLNSVHLDAGSDAESQDSGFSGSFCEKSCLSSVTPSRGPSVRSTVFTDEETEDGFMHMFDLDDDMDESSCMPDVMTSLLTKPICGISLIDNESVNSSQDPVHPVKKKSRRRLTMTPDSPLCGGAYTNRSPLYSFLLSKRKPEQKNFEVSNTSEKTAAHCRSSGSNEDIENNSKRANSMNVISTDLPFKRPDPPENLSPLLIKRRKRSPLSYCMKSQLTLTKKTVIQRCFSESEASIMKAVQKSDEQPDLIGDFSKPYVLPMISGRHQDMKTVTPATLAQLLKGVYANPVVNFKVVDCRYPYEFSGGHIKGALNIFTREGILSSLLPDPPQLQHKDQRNIVVFHCEFSSERAPSLCRFLRNQDREYNKESYPQLCHPEVYLLEGGYKAFFESFKELCEPQNYTPMLHKDHEKDLRNFRAKSKSWGGSQQKKRENLRIGRKFQAI